MRAEDKKEIEQLVEKFRVVVQTHGGDVQVSDITGNIVTLKSLGACVNCSLAHLSYDTMLGGLIKEKFPKVEIQFERNSARGGKKYAESKRIYKK